MKAAIDRTRQFDIPHDVQYGDIDYMDRERIFTIDPVHFVGLEDYVDQLKVEGTRFVIILDPAVSITEPRGGYPAYDEGERLGVWVTEEDGRTPAEGEVWPGAVYYPDYTKDVTARWWSELTQEFKTRLDFAGLWIDMNEPSNFIHGRPGGCPDNQWNYPPYVPKLEDGKLMQKTLCMETQQQLGRQYDVHSLYGWSMANHSLIAARETFPGLRSVVFSRSTFPGAGKWAQHWYGDNFSQWSNLRWSIIAMFEFNMFGFPYGGSDICGFIGVTTEEMCLRWQQLGAFYPFSRSHNAAGEPDQDPGIWPEVARVTRETQLIRYTLLPYLYTLFHHSHMTASTVVRPLLFEFVGDETTRDLTDQFLWGSGFMITPVLDQGRRTVISYFPDERWYSYYDGREMGYRGVWRHISAGLDFIPLYVRGGTIIPTQQPANSTVFSRLNPMGLIVALGDAESASGDLFWDDGESLDTQKSGHYFSADYLCTKIGERNQLVSIVNRDGYQGVSDLVMDTVRVFGTDRSVAMVTLNDEMHTDWEQNAQTRELVITNLNLALNTEYALAW